MAARGRIVKAGRPMRAPAASLTCDHSPMPAAQRDPVSETMDRAARQLLGRAYNARGGWASTRLKDPTAAQLARWLLQGINVLGRDPVPRGGFNARTRWARAYCRALWFQHKWFSGDPDTGGWRAERRTTMRTPGIEIEVGRHKPVLGVLPAGFAIRVRVADTRAAARRNRDRETWAWNEDGEPGPRWGDPADRDWPAFGG